ncbi:MAG: slipin family protein [bacterium]|nr:slipin family protein [bacterium]
MLNTPILITTLTLLFTGLWLVSRVRRETVYSGYRALRLVRGVIQDELGPGRHWVIGSQVEVFIYDLRESVATVANQEVLTRDQVPVKLSLAIAWRLSDLRTAYSSTTSYEAALHLAGQLALRAAVAKTELEALLDDRAALDVEIGAQLAPEMERLGLELVRASLKDVMMAGDLKRAFAEVAKARAEARARLERTRGETASLRSLTNAARLFREHGGLYELRLLETAREAAAAEGNTLVLGVPDGLQNGHKSL